ncbi:hypothetical protein R1sor_018405 [Riccia sorocarpa]|uniref:Uncharacterized protein n=1 Tax=Riccia sorocarpa TaxID=122646 RepID=A0ABD3I9P4_9MARC
MRGAQVAEQRVMRDSQKDIEDRMEDPDIGIDNLDQLAELVEGGGISDQEIASEVGFNVEVISAAGDVTIPDSQLRTMETSNNEFTLSSDIQFLV